MGSRETARISEALSPLLAVVPHQAARAGVSHLRSVNTDMVRRPYLEKEICDGYSMDLSLIADGCITQIDEHFHKLSIDYDEFLRRDEEYWCKVLEERETAARARLTLVSSEPGFTGERSFLRGSLSTGQW